MIDDADAGVRVAAMKAIGSIGAGKEAAALLSAHLADPALRSAALDALGKIGRPAAAVIPQLTSLYAGADAVTRAQVLRIFESVGQDAHAALSMIEGALGDADENVRAAAMTALAQVQNDRAVAMNAAIAALKDSARPVRLAAAIAISRIGEQSAEKAIPAINPLFEIIQNEPDHTYAMETLRAIRVKDAAAIAHALTLQNEEILMWAAERVARMGKAGRSFIPELEKLRASGNDGLRNAARRAIDSLNR
jgi:HEAT repeat protein